MNFRVYCHIRGIGQLTSVCEELLKRIRSEELQRVPRCPSAVLLRNGGVVEIYLICPSEGTSGEELTPLPRFACACHVMRSFHFRVIFSLLVQMSRPTCVS